MKTNQFSAVVRLNEKENQSDDWNVAERGGNIVGQARGAGSGGRNGRRRSLRSCVLAGRRAALGAISAFDRAATTLTKCHVRTLLGGPFFCKQVVPNAGTCQTGGGLDLRLRCCNPHVG